jgi:hypothetical protein
MWSASAHEAKRMCLKMKHILTSGGKCKKLNPMTPISTSTLGVTLMQESQMFKALIEKVNKHQMGSLGIIIKVLKCKHLKCPHIVHVNLKSMNYDFFLKVKSQIGNLIPNHKSLQVGVKSSLIRTCNTLLEISF